MKRLLLLIATVVTSTNAFTVSIDEHAFSFIDKKIFLCSSDGDQYGHIFYFGEGKGFRASRGSSMYWHYSPITLIYKNDQVMSLIVEKTTDSERRVIVSRNDGSFKSFDYKYETKWVSNEEGCAGCSKIERTDEYVVNNRFSGTCKISDGPETFEKFLELVEEPKAF